MRFRVRERPYDLYAVMASSTLLLIVLIAIPGATTLRIILGLPFILLFPGYSLVCALYPERPVLMEDAPSPAPDDGFMKDVRITRAYKRQLRRERKKPLEEQAPDEDTPVKTKGLDHLERLALSLGLSIAISPLIGLLLNYTYDWDPKNLGIRLTTVFGGLYLFIMITSAAALRRRLALPEEDRYGFDVDLSMPSDYSTADKALTVGIGAMMVLSVSLLIYIIAFPREGERFTEFYVLGRQGKADDYPRFFAVGEHQRITIGIGNHEQRDLNYTVVMTLNEGGSNRTYYDFDNVTIADSSDPLMEVRVADGRTREIPVNFSIPQPGSFKLTMLLYLEGEVYRDLHLWVKSFPPNLLGETGSGIQFFVTGSGGDPSTAGTVIEDTVVAGFGVVNPTDRTLNCNVTFHTSQPRSFIRAQTDNGTWAIDDRTGAYVRVIAEGGRTAYFEVTLRPSEGPSNMTVTMRSGNDIRIVLRVPFTEEIP